MSSKPNCSTSKTKTVIFTQDRVNEFCRCVNDLNPIHRPDYPNPTVPGMLTTAFLFEDLVNHTDPNFTEWTRLALINIKFRDVVLVGKETVYEYNTVFFRARHRKFKVLVKQDNKICVEAEYLVVKKDPFEADQH